MFTNTDNSLYEIETKDVYEDVYEDIYSKFFDPVNKKAIGKMAYQFKGKNTFWLM